MENKLGLPGYQRVNLKELRQNKCLKETEFKLGKCVYCRGKSRLGIHDNCWKHLKGWLLDSRFIVQSPVGEDYDDYRANGQTFYDKGGRHVVEGHVLPSQVDYQ